MKIRLGFVSNSSASSFTILGWRLDALPQDNPDEETERFVKALAVPNKFRWELQNAEDSSGNIIVGVGTYETEVDHGYEGDWEEYESPGPTNAAITWLQKRARELGLEVPEFYSETWFDG